jgi:hypothetical protein
LTYDRNETQPWLTLTGPPFSASKSGHRSFRTARTVLAATASEVTKLGFPRMDAAEPQRVQQFRAGPQAIILQFRATPRGIICFCAKLHIFPNNYLLIRDDIE